MKIAGQKDKETEGVKEGEQWWEKDEAREGEREREWEREEVGVG